MYDKTTYPPGDNILKDTSTCVPPTLLTSLEKVTVNKTRDLEKRKRKCITIAHSIISSVRPLSFILGFCSSYYEVQLLEMSSILHTHPNMNWLFSQFVFDNADFNVCTIDGLNTFHAMGGIRCTAPESSVIRRTEISKLTKIPSSKSSGEFGVLPLEVLGKWKVRYSWGSKMEGIYAFYNKTCTVKRQRMFPFLSLTHRHLIMTQSLQHYDLLLNYMSKANRSPRFLHLTNHFILKVTV
ncbi:hypothetical protein PR048_031466 [Dryococelus australis]|uniref:Uncharacterized protein n=1 Tax=Dryococelus australis TaxID=614101 RepID=A0ABQ9G630_9NEOP|nr:hypothetical protein PR048_031466 [Dryococelus australis]